MFERKEIINAYLQFFKSKNHAIMPSASLIPENDPTVLFTTAGMHPLVPYLLGQKHPLGKRLCNVQKCIRTGDIEEVGDESHHTFFEMMGNWSLGDYFKKEAIEFSFEFLTKTLKIPKEEISVTCFKGDENAEKDEESAKIWKSLGIKKIEYLSKEDNWWGPAGNTGPCGPDTEMFVNKVEIWNDVFMQYNKTKEGKYEILKQKNVDTGMGVERTLSILNNLNDNYQTDCFKPIIEKIEELSKKKYGKNKNDTQAMRIIADHIKASVFILAENISPSNTEQGYVLRRLIRRAVRYGNELGMKNFTTKLVEQILSIYHESYPELKSNKKFILEELKKEEEKFELTLEKGLKEFEKMSKNNKITGKESFLLYQSYGFPLEMIKEECKKKKITLKGEDFYEEFNKHKELSRTATQGKFKSGLADNSEQTTKLHTASHLLLAALRNILKDENIIQKGSNITAERLRFDFSFSRQLTKEEIKQVEDLVNAQVQGSCEVVRQEMSLKEAKKCARGIFENKYGDIVSVYTIGKGKKVFSSEICAGPHVNNTCQLGKFKITKEESSGAGVRRIRAILD
ncbi:MAG: alanine--tRNA ligase [archaeon]|nr:alanine--tRNA ligase [archaeon]